MSLLAARLSRIKPSPTNTLTGLVAELKAAGRDVIGLGAGEPDFPTPENIAEAGVRAIRGGQTRYTPIAGTMAVREAICAKLARDNALGYTPRQISVSCGGKQVLYNAFVATLDEGDEVVIPTPYWVSYPDMVLLAGGTPVYVEGREANGFRIHAADLDAAIGPKTKWVVLNSPSNPSGAAYTAEALAEICAVLMKHPHVWVLSDDIYEHIVYDGFRFASPGQVEPRADGPLAYRQRCLQGLLHDRLAPRLRRGPGRADRCDEHRPVAELHPHVVDQPGRHRRGAHRPAGLYCQAQRDLFARGRDLVVAMLNQAHGITCRTPEGAFYVLPSCAGAIGRRTPDGAAIETDTDFVAYLLKAEGVAVVQGAAFGLSPYFRISYAAATETLEEACRRIHRACAALA